MMATTPVTTRSYDPRLRVIERKVGTTAIYSFRTKKEIIPRRHVAPPRNTWLLYPAKYLEVNTTPDHENCKVSCLVIHENGEESRDPWKGAPPAYALAACPKCFPRRETQ